MPGFRLARRVVPGDALPQIPCGKPWVVFAKAAVQGADKVLEYLGRYVHKTAIADNAITSIDDRSVTFRYCDSRTHERKAMTPPAPEFLRRFLQHVLPKGMHPVRASGLLHPAHRPSLLQLPLTLAHRPAPSSATPRPARSRLRCPTCNGSMRLLHLSLEACAAIVAARGPATHRSRAPPPPHRAPPRRRPREASNQVAFRYPAPPRRSCSPPSGLPSIRAPQRSSRVPRIHFCSGHARVVRLPPLHRGPPMPLRT